MFKIYISSTYIDLKEFREAVYQSLNQSRDVKVIAMEDYVAKDQRPLQMCLDDVASSDIYVGIFAWRYGYVPPNDNKDNPDNLSITEMEYRKAKEKGIPCLIFLLDEETAWPPKYIDGMVQSGIIGSENINRLRNELKQFFTVSFFKNKDRLAGSVYAAASPILTELEKNSANKSRVLSSPSVPVIPVEFGGEKKIFVGREEYINKIIKEKLLPLGSIVSLIGPGGSGKTQLAFRAMRKYVEEEKLFDIVIPIYFSRGIITLSLLLSKMAESLGISITEFEKETDMEKRRQVVKATLKAKKHPLIYLDNYEQISLDLNKQNMDTRHKPSEDAKQIEYFLKNNLPDNTSILLTSRETNNRLGEIPITITGLQNEESQKLFSKIARSVLGDGTMDSKSAHAIDKIIKITGGHPLTLEIIASNIDSIQNLKKMADEMQIKIGESNIYNPDERLRSLQASFDYTVNGLGEKLKGLLLKLTIFNSPFPIDAPSKILSSVVDDVNYDENDIIQLYNRSLLTRIESDDLYGKVDPGYWLYTFHQATRNYLEKVRGLSSSNLEKIYGQSFYKYYFNLLYDTEHSIGKEKVHRQIFARFNLIFNQDVSNNDFSRAIILARDNEDLWYCANSSRSIGLILQTFGTFSKALEYHKKALDFNQEMNNRGAMAGDYGNIGLVYYEIGNYPQALEYHKKALEIDEKEINNRERMAGDYGNIGLVYRYMRDYPQALEYHKKALEIHEEELNDRERMAEDYNNIGIVYRVIGNYPQALEYHKKALEIHEKELNNRGRMADGYRNIGLVYYEIGNYPQALEYHKKALEINTELNYKMDIAKNHYNMSFPLYKMNERSKALEQLTIALNILIEFREQTGYSHPLLKDIESRIALIKQEQSD